MSLSVGRRKQWQSQEFTTMGSNSFKKLITLSFKNNFQTQIPNPTYTYSSQSNKKQIENTLENTNKFLSQKLAPIWVIASTPRTALKQQLPPSKWCLMFFSLSASVSLSQNDWIDCSFFFKWESWMLFHKRVWLSFISAPHKLELSTYCSCSLYCCCTKPRGIIKCLIHFECCQSKRLCLLSH